MGRQIPLLTNFFKVEIPPDLTLYHYDVVIEPNVPRAVKRKVMQTAKQQHSQFFAGQSPVFDGEKMSTLTKSWIMMRHVVRVY